MMNRLPALLVLACALLWSSGLAAQDARHAPLTPQDAATFTIMFENDLFADTDQNYTSGIQLNWLSPDLTEYRDSEQLPAWVVPLVERLPFINEPGLQRNIGFGLGQKIFTPEDTERRELIPDDQPYAAWLYMSAAFHSKDVHELTTFEIQLGVVGPAAFGEETQNLVHDLRGIPEARGWDNQLDNEPGIILIAEQKDRLFEDTFHSRFGYDVISHYGGGLGNVHTYGSAGIEARVGWNLPRDFGMARIRPGGDTNAPAAASDPRLTSAAFPFSLHLFAGVTGNVVLRNIFLDGNTFSSSHSVDKRYLVGDFAFGASLIYGRFKLSYAQVFRSKEFDQQDDDHQFGSISLSYTF